MPIQNIKLEQGEWELDTDFHLGPPGGFGEVFKGKGDCGEVAIKRLKIDAGAAAHREMKIGSELANRSHDHVVPIIDSGQDANGDRYYLVMPICERSLKDEVASKGVLTWDEGRVVALNIISGLLEVADIVHRDLKPDNVLFHNGRWCIADFGIAKFVEDATSLRSVRNALTAAYAAPEQWRGERPTQATDVYALGCTLHAMLSGNPPFVGSNDDLRENHLHSPPPSIPGIEPRLSSLINSMLRKSPVARPDLQRCKSVIEAMPQTAVSSGRAALMAAGSIVSQAEASAEADRQALETKKRERMELADEALQELEGMISRLFGAIEESTDSSSRTRHSISLGSAQLLFEEATKNFAGPSKVDDPYLSGWDIVTSAYLSVSCELPSGGNPNPVRYKFSTTLVYANNFADTNYRWRELSFCSLFGGKPMALQPYSLNPMKRTFYEPLSNGMGVHSLAYEPFCIDAENEENFQDRWLSLFAKAAKGQLLPPSQLPLPLAFFD